MFLSNNSSKITITNYIQYISEKDINTDQSSFNSLTLLSPIIVIITFIISQLISESSRRKELKRNWYYKAHLESSINKTEDLLSKSSSILEDYFTESKENKTQNPDYLINKALKLDELKELIRRYEFETINPLKLLYPEVFDSSITELQEFQDSLTELLDIKNDFSKAMNKWYEIKGTIKAKLLNVLSRPILFKKKNNLFNRFKVNII